LQTVHDFCPVAIDPSRFARFNSLARFLEAFRAALC